MVKFLLIIALVLLLAALGTDDPFTQAALAGLSFIVTLIAMIADILRSRRLAEERWRKLD